MKAKSSVNRCRNLSLRILERKSDVDQVREK